MDQKQILLTLGIIIIVLLLIDAYRRTKRKKAKLLNSAKNKDKSPTLDDQEENSDEKDDDVDTSIEQNELEKNEPKLSDDNAIDENDENTSKEKQTFDREDEKNDLTETWEEAVEKNLRKRLAEKKAIRAEELQSKHQEIKHNSDSLNKSTSSSSMSSKTPLEQGIIVLHIMAPRGYVFYGEDLVSLFEKYGFSYSKTQTFQSVSITGDVLFDIVTSNEPGIFDLNNLSSIRTPGISIFMDINKLAEPIPDFKHMLAQMYEVAEQLGGTLLNEHRRRFTQRDISRCIARIKQTDTPMRINSLG